MASGRGSIVVRHYVPAPALFVKRVDTPGSDSQPRGVAGVGNARGRQAGTPSGEWQFCYTPEWTLLLLRARGRYRSFRAHVARRKSTQPGPESGIGPQPFGRDSVEASLQVLVQMAVLLFHPPDLPGVEAVDRPLIGLVRSSEAGLL